MELNPKITYSSAGLNYKQAPGPVSGGASGTSTSFATPPQPYNGIETAVPSNADITTSLPVGKVR
jgi:hypothetical protein